MCAVQYVPSAVMFNMQGIQTQSSPLQWTIQPGTMPDHVVGNIRFIATFSTVYDYSSYPFDMCVLF